MGNRLATLEVYTVPEEYDGRKEASWILDRDGRLLKKQNLILRIWDLEKNVESEVKQISFFYKREFTDSLDIHNRISEIVDKFKGTWSRSSSDYEDNASFETKQRNELINYLYGLEKKL